MAMTFFFFMSKKRAVNGECTRFLNILTDRPESL
jgi:hypothetical protein